MRWPRALRRWAISHSFGRRLPLLGAFCVAQNEEIFLREFLLYHRALGVARFYVFLDRSTDRSEAIARSFPWVSVIIRARDPEKTLWNHLHQHACGREALRMARRDGMEWLLHDDPDEFAFGEHTLALTTVGRWMLRIGLVSKLELKGFLPAMLASLQPETNQVIMRTKEVSVVEDLPENRGFWTHEYFQQGPAIRRAMWDPLEKKRVQLNQFFGHSFGKSIVRLSADVQAFDPHSWTTEQHVEQPEKIPIPTEQRGFHYHYVIVSSHHWELKYRKRLGAPDHWPRGQEVRFPRRSWKYACATLSAEEIKNYYAEWVCLNPQVLAEALAGGLLTRETIVTDLLRTIGAI